MAERWERALRNCVQHVPDEDDLDYQPGVMALKPLEELLAVLSAEQIAALGWFSLADVAVWPQVVSDEGPKIAEALEQGEEVQLNASGGAGKYALVGMKAAGELLGFVTAAEKHRQAPDAEEAPSASVLQQAVNEVAQLSQDPDSYWVEWLLRVVPAAGRIGAVDARQYAIDAFRCTLKSVAPKWDYEAGLTEEDAPEGVVYRGCIALVTPGRGGDELYDIGVFSDYEPQGRRMTPELRPLVAIDRYRMGYLFQTTLMAYFFEDSYSGRYDEVVCTNTQTGENWSYYAP